MGEPLSTNDFCFGCGTQNPAGLGLRPERYGDGVRALWTPDTRFRGYSTIAHGGVVAAVLDELMGFAIIADAVPPHATARMEVRYRAPVRIGRAYWGTARIVGRAARTLELHAELRSAADDVLAASAEGTFVRLREETAADFMGQSSDREA
jgi:acyl-coenzyme A thioesterase PaaI-like protein